MFSDALIRPRLPPNAKPSKRGRRDPSLSNLGDREALLANSDAIELPSEQIAAGQVFVPEQSGAIVAFATDGRVRDNRS